MCFVRAAHSSHHLVDKLTLFDHASATGTSGAFQIGVATETNNLVAMSQAAFYFRAHSNVTRVLWFKFSTKDSAVYQSRQGITLNSEVYATVRDTARQKLGDRAQHFIADLEI
jgi:hypothetical protein